MHNAGFSDKEITEAGAWLEYLEDSKIEERTEGENNKSVQ